VGLSELSKVVRAKYENGVLKLLEPVDLQEGKEVYVRIERYKDRLMKLRKYRGILGKASREEIEELLLEAEFERF
jgi:predicted DNA-binding antitoxin AbrB/MazE fold protein